MPDLVCIGLDGTNPLGMLASLGLFRLLVTNDPEVRMGWVKEKGWHPIFQSKAPWEKESLLESLTLTIRGLGAVKAGDIKAKQRSATDAKAKIKPLQEKIKQRSAQALADAKSMRLKGAEAKAHAKEATRELDAELRTTELDLERSRELLADALGQGIAHLGDVIGVQPEVFRSKAIEALTVPSTGESRLIIDCLSSQASDACLDSDRLAYTPFSFSNGGAGQCLLKDFRTLATDLSQEELAAALFSRVPVLKESTSVKKVPNLNWDPRDQRSYALQWRKPETEAKKVNVAANALAFVGLALLPAVPGPKRLRAVGFGGGNSAWTWPLWDTCLGSDVIRGLLADAALQVASPDTVHLAARGIVAHCRTQRVSPNKRSFFAPVETR